MPFLSLSQSRLPSYSLLIMLNVYQSFTSPTQPFDISSLFCRHPAFSKLFSPPPLLPLTSLPIGPAADFLPGPGVLFPVCPGAGGNLSRETNCLVAASCERLAQLGMPSRVTPPETNCGRLHTQIRARACSPHKHTHPHRVVPSAAICPLQLRATR